MKSKNKKLIITAIVFFLLVNTTYYWEGRLGTFAFPTFIILVIIYLVLVIGLGQQLYVAIKQKLSDNSTLFVVGLLTLVLVLTLYKPFGLVRFERLEADDLLVAQREGSANCTTTLRLKEDLSFRGRNVCFGITETNGTFYLQNDTIFFDNVSSGRHSDELYKYAVIKPSQYNKNGKHYDLAIYRSLKDTTGYNFVITKNDLKNLKTKVQAVHN